MSKPPTPFKLPDEFEELDFEIVHEGWNTYELSDGITIKSRTFLKKIVVDPNNPNNYAFDTMPLVSSVYAPLANRGEKDNPPKPGEYNTLPSYEVKVDRSDEPFNVYRILKNGKTLRIKLVVTKVTRLVDCFDKDGLPFYIISHGPMVLIDKEKSTEGAA